MQGQKRRAVGDSFPADVQPAPKVQRLDHQTPVANRALKPPVAQLPSNQSSRAHRCTALHSFEHKTKENPVSGEIRSLFREEPDVADTVLDLANLSKPPIAPIIRRQMERGRLGEESRLPSGSGAPAYPTPSASQLTLTTPVKRPGGFLYDGPYPRLEHDYNAEAKVYETRKDERRKARETAIAENPPMYPFASTSDQPLRSTGYGKVMGSGGVGTLRYLGINWESAEKGSRDGSQHGYGG